MYLYEESKVVSERGIGGKEGFVKLLKKTGEMVTDGNLLERFYIRGHNLEFSSIRKADYIV